MEGCTGVCLLASKKKILMKDREGTTYHRHDTRPHTTKVGYEGIRGLGEESKGGRRGGQGIRRRGLVVDWAISPPIVVDNQRVVWYDWVIIGSEP